MADYAISNVPRRVVYAASGTGPYAFTFEVLSANDIAVYKGDTLLTLTTDYTVTINANGTGSVTLVSTAGTSNITIVGAKTIARTTDFTTGGDFFANTLNDELDAQTIFIQQVAETAERGLKAPVTDPTDINMTLPRKIDRAGKYLVFDSNGNPAPGEIPEDVSIVADNIDKIGDVADNETNINTVAGQITPTNNVATVAGISSEIITVANNTTNINTVAGISANITTVAGIDDDVTAVATNIADVIAVAPVAAGLGEIITALPAIEAVSAELAGDDSIGLVADNISSVQTLGSDLGGSGFSYDLGSITDAAVGPSASPDGFIVSVYNQLDDIAAVVAGQADIGTVSTNIADVNTVATNISSVNTAASNIAEIIEVANDLNEAVSEIDVVANNISVVQAVGADIANVNTVAGISSDISTVANDSADIQLLADNIAAISAKANSGANSDITSLSGLTTPISTAQGGTGGDGDKGDIVISGGGTIWSIENGAVTVAKLSTTLDLGSIA